MTNGDRVIMALTMTNDKDNFTVGREFASSNKHVLNQAFSKCHN
jgi:hypothetical protein